MTRSETVVRTLALVASSMLFSGCASQQTVPQEDRWEGMNRVIYGFNDGVDRVLLKPIATGYRFITPDPVERGVRNVFGNLAYPTVIVNNLLQGKPGAAISDTGRFIVNSTVGVAGIFDVASNIGLEEHDEDFGQTLAVWGVGSGPYVVLPFLGPSTLRDAFGIPADRATNVIEHLERMTPLDSMLEVLRRPGQCIQRPVPVRARGLPAAAQLPDLRRRAAGRGRGLRNRGRFRRRSVARLRVRQYAHSLVSYRKPRQRSAAFSRSSTSLIDAMLRRRSGMFWKCISRTLWFAHVTHSSSSAR